MTMGRFGLCCGPFWLYDGPFWTTQWDVLDNFLGITIFGAVLARAVLAMGRFGIAPVYLPTGSTDYERDMSTPPTLHLEYDPPLPFYPAIAGEVLLWSPVFV